MNDEFFEKRQKKRWTPQEATALIRKYCVFQERSHQEVRYKLVEHGIYGDILEEIIADLIAENYLDEERFARTFARGKFRFKQWGRLKITNELKQKGVSAYSIRAAMEEIPDNEYLQTLTQLLSKKASLSQFENQFEKKQKLSDYALSKGYEFDVIRNAMDQLDSDMD